MAPLDTDFSRVTLTHYITGNAAINFPWRDATTGGWHRLAYWIKDKGEVRIALAGYHYPDTSAYLAEYGIEEVTHMLIRRGWKVEHPVFMATHFRAAADLAISWALSQAPHSNVELVDWFPEEKNFRAITDLLRLTAEKLDPFSRARLNQWLEEQLQAAQ